MYTDYRLIILLLSLLLLLLSLVVNIRLWRQAMCDRRELDRLQIVELDLQQDLQRSDQQRDQMQREVEQMRERAQLAETANAVLKERLSQESSHYQEQITSLTAARAQLGQEFEQLAAKIFEVKQQQFNQHSKQTLEATLAPMKTQLQEFRHRVEEVYDKENADRNKLVGQLGELQKQTLQISEDAINLTNALKGNNKTQGNWGEVILERLLEESGLQKDREYETQVALRTEQGRRRNPDVIIRLPDNKDIIIDAKVSLLGYERYCSAENDSEREQALKQHLTSLRNHIASLSLKDYEKLKNIRTLDFVFIFIPIEAAFILALQSQPALFREAYNKHVILASPTTLLATLRTVEGVWRYEKQNKNAEKIADQAGALYDQFVSLTLAFEEVGRHLYKAQDAYSTVQKRLASGRGNLVKRVEAIKKLGAKTKKSIAYPLLAEANSNTSTAIDSDFVEECPASSS